MTKHYIETRGRIRPQLTNMASDIMRHFHARQHLGTALVVCEDPEALLAAAGKQWLRLSRLLQRRRGSATNAVEILKLTHTITQMQHLEFVAQPPHERPEAAVYFVKPGQTRQLPANCLTVYLAASVSETAAAALMKELPAYGLVVDYSGGVEAGDFGLRAKADLEADVAATWCAVDSFLTKYQISVVELTPSPTSAEAFDDALDVLLGVGTEFLGIANLFQRTLDLARPLRTIPKLQRDRYDAFMMLAHRVQTLSPGHFSPQFLNTYADDTFFLNDRGRTATDWAALLESHRLAGRSHLVSALMEWSAASQRYPSGMMVAA